jgi:hypothetical protein
VQFFTVATSRSEAKWQVRILRLRGFFHGLIFAGILARLAFATSVP